MPWPSQQQSQGQQGQSQEYNQGQQSWQGQQYNHAQQQGQYPPTTVPDQQSRQGGTVYGAGGGASAASPSSGAPAGTGNPYGVGSPGLRNVGGPASNQVYYPDQQQPALQMPNPVESSGSLTGHILSQGRADTPTPKSRIAKVVIILVVVLVVMVALGLLAATIFNGVISDLLGGALG